jgi:hypothetical protein
MSQKGYPGYQSIFFKNLSTTQNKRLEKDSYHQVLLQVSSLCSKISPRGCSQNTRVSYDDIDRTQEQIRSKVRTSKQFAEQELSKLNNPMRFTTSSSPRGRKVTFVDKLKLEKVHRNRCFCKEEKPKGNCLDEVIDKCEVFQPLILPQKKEIVSHAFYRLNTSGFAYNYIEDLSECLKNTDDQERIWNMMSTLKYNRNTDKSLKNELKFIKGELLQTTKKIVKMTPYKLWRQNNIAFMSNADKVIFSLPTVKN